MHGRRAVRIPLTRMGTVLDLVFGFVANGSRTDAKTESVNAFAHRPKILSRRIHHELVRSEVVQQNPPKPNSENTLTSSELIAKVSPWLFF